MAAPKDYTDEPDRLAVFLDPFRINPQLVHKLAQDFCNTFSSLAADSEDQFLPTPISESILSDPENVRSPGPHLAIDIGGTNLRVAFVELSQVSDRDQQRLPLRRHLEHSWPIGSHLKNENAENLFAWIGTCIAEVVSKAGAQLKIAVDKELPLGITFSFPMDQESLEKANLRPMGKGFAITSDLDLSLHLLNGYEKSRGNLPRLRIAAILNDSVATLVSFMHQFPPCNSAPATAQARALQYRPAMGLICGTGCNATVFMNLDSLGQTKRPKSIRTLPSHDDSKIRIAVNTEWSINGSAGPLRSHNLISRWDDQLSKTAARPGFQPLEYMTAGLYLGELGRIVLVDYMSSVLGMDRETFPPKLLRSFEPQNTTLLSHFGPRVGGEWSRAVSRLQVEFPPAAGATFSWNEELAQALYRIARAVEYRAAGIIAAATVGLLKCSGALPSTADLSQLRDRPTEVQLGVGYTGGCITNFQDYLLHCQQLLDHIMDSEYPADSEGSSSRVRVVLKPCHDGGIAGAGILVPAAIAAGV